MAATCGAESAEQKRPGVAAGNTGKRREGTQGAQLLRKFVPSYALRRERSGTLLKMLLARKALLHAVA